MDDTTRDASPNAGAPRASHAAVGFDASESSVCPEARSALTLALVGIVLFGCLLGPLAIRQALVAKDRIRGNPLLRGTTRAHVALGIGLFDIALSLALVLWNVARSVP